MIETYQTTEARRTLNRVGWPEWGEEGHDQHYALFCRLDGFKVQATRAHSEGVEHIVPHVALCLLRNHVHEWLRANHTCLSPNISKEGVVYWCESSGGLKQFFDEDEALLARAEAVLAKNES